MFVTIPHLPARPHTANPEMFTYDSSVFNKHKVRICAELHRATKITFFCGAGVSTSSGILDFRSANGLYARNYHYNGTTLNGRELFDSATLNNINKVALLNIILTKIRIKCRDAAPTAFHNLVHELHRQGRLQRCYTQNFDGLQTRDYPALTSMVHELHGSNQRVRCLICRAVCNLPLDCLDQEFLNTGLVHCLVCQANVLAAESQKKRGRPVGYLVPDLLYNDEELDVGEEGTGLGRQLVLDSSSELLIIAGTSLKTPGAFALAKYMAKRTRHEKGAVLYVDMSQASAKVAEFVDIQLKLDIEAWSTGMLEILSHCSFLKAGQIQERLERLDQHITQPVGVVPTDFTVLGPHTDTTTEPLLVLLLYKPGLFDDAKSFKELLEICMIEAKVSCNVMMQHTGHFDGLPRLDNNRPFHFVALYIASRCSVGFPVEADYDYQVCQMLSVTRKILRSSQTLMLSHNVLILGGHQPMRFPILRPRLVHEVKHEHNFGEIVACLTLQNISAHDCASMVVSLASRWMNTIEASNFDPVQSLIAAWSERETVHSRSNLLYVCARRSPSLLLSSPWDLRPLGRPFPDIETVCDCKPRSSANSGRKWQVVHTAKHGISAPHVVVQLTCSQCRSTWHISNNLRSGTVREANGRFTVEHMLSDR
ncbi:DHS-like NAD/FAD-binding domain-containing protein, partial [Ceratobasidium sp. AG-I]